MMMLAGLYFTGGDLRLGEISWKSKTTTWAIASGIFTAAGVLLLAEALANKQGSAGIATLANTVGMVLTGLIGGYLFLGDAAFDEQKLVGTGMILSGFAIVMWQ